MYNRVQKINTEPQYFVSTLLSVIFYLTVHESSVFLWAYRPASLDSATPAPIMAREKTKEAKTRIANAIVLSSESTFTYHLHYYHV